MARRALLVEARGDQRRPDRPRRHGVHADPLPLPQGLRKRARQRHDRALRRGVVRQLRAALVGGDGGRVDDAGPLRHPRQRLADHPDVAEDVGAEGALDQARVDLGEVFRLVLLRGVVDEDADRAVEEG